MPSSGTLRKKKTAATRDHILEEAYRLLIDHPDKPFSHEAIARGAGVGARTVYRYFPTQADLYEELWLRIRQESGTVFPDTEAEIVPRMAALFAGFDRNETLVKAVLESSAGKQVRERGAAEGRSAFTKSLNELTAGMSPADRRRVVAVFLALYSAPFWDLLRTRGGLSGKDAIAAAQLVTQIFIRGLREKSQSTSVDDRGQKQ